MTDLEKIGSASRRQFLSVGALGGTAVLLSACGATTAGPAASAAPRTGRVYLSILTGDQIGKKEWPALVPGNFKLPAHATVTVELVNFDDATPLASGAEQFAKVTGTVGNTITVVSWDPTNPSADGSSQQIASLDAAKVSHTITADKLGLNIPVPGKSKVVFQIQTGDPGSYDWVCMDPCGTDPNGTGGAMQAAGYMKGTITVE
jgi:hypothetical protein